MTRIAMAVLLAAALSTAPLPAEEGVLRYVRVHETSSVTVEIEVSRSAGEIRVKSEGGGRSEESIWVPGQGSPLLAAGRPCSGI